MGLPRAPSPVEQLCLPWARDRKSLGLFKIICGDRGWTKTLEKRPQKCVCRWVQSDSALNVGNGCSWVGPLRCHPRALSLYK